MNEEKMKILKMLEDKKISAEDAAKLIESLDSSEGKEDIEPVKRGKTLRIRVYENDSDKPKVNLNVPLGWSKLIMPFIGAKVKDKLKEKGIDVDIDKIKESLNDGYEGRIIDVDDGGDKVEIYID